MILSPACRAAGWLATTATWWPRAQSSAQLRERTWRANLQPDGGGAARARSCRGAAAVMLVPRELASSRCRERGSCTLQPRAVLCLRALRLNTRHGSDFPRCGLPAPSVYAPPRRGVCRTRVRSSCLPIGRQSELPAFRPEKLGLSE